MYKWVHFSVCKFRIGLCFMTDKGRNLSWFAHHAPGDYSFKLYPFGGWVKRER